MSAKNVLSKAKPAEITEDKKESKSIIPAPISASSSSSSAVSSSSSSSSLPAKTKTFRHLSDLFRVQGDYSHASQIVFIDLDNFAVFSEMKRRVPDDVFVCIFAGAWTLNKSTIIQRQLDVSLDNLKRLNRYFADPSLAKIPKRTAIAADSEEEDEEVDEEDEGADDSADEVDDDEEVDADDDNDEDEEEEEEEEEKDEKVGENEIEESEEELLSVLSDSEKSLLSSTIDTVRSNGSLESQLKKFNKLQQYMKMQADLIKKQMKHERISMRKRQREEKQGKDSVVIDSFTASFAPLPLPAAVSISMPSKRSKIEQSSDSISGVSAMDDLDTQEMFLQQWKQQLDAPKKMTKAELNRTRPQREKEQVERAAQLDLSVPITAPEALKPRRQPSSVNQNPVLSLIWRGMIHFVAAGASKDAADFALVMFASKLDLKLPSNVPFTIISQDTGFKEALKHFNPDRKARIVNPQFSNMNEVSFKKW